MHAFTRQWKSVRAMDDKTAINCINNALKWMKSYVSETCGKSTRLHCLQRCLIRLTFIVCYLLFASAALTSCINQFLTTRPNDVPFYPSLHCFKGLAHVATRLKKTFCWFLFFFHWIYHRKFRVSIVTMTKRIQILKKFYYLRPCLFPNT